MEKVILFHGTPAETVVPTYGLGDEKHDYGKGFYLTEDIELAKEWAVCRPDKQNGWVHKFALKLDGLRILDFQKLDVLAWIAELMKHRHASDSKRYRVLSAKFIDRYGVDTEGYDVIKGWRANASYFYIAKEFVRDNVDVDILEEDYDGIIKVDYDEFNVKYNQRDAVARDKMRNLIDSDANRVTNVFSTLMER